MRWIFPKLFYSRVPRYEGIAKKYGYTVSARDIFNVRSEADFFEIIAQAITKKEQE